MNQLKTLGVAVAAFGMTAALIPAQAADKFSVKAGGRIQLDAALVDSDDDEAVQNHSGSEFRRARAFLKGSGFGNIDYKIQIDFDQGGSSISFEDVYLRFGLGGGKLWLGNFHAPFGMEEVTSSKYIDFMERSMVSSAIDLGRNRGVGYSWGNDSMYVMGTAFSQQNDEGEGEDDERLGVAARFAFAPVANETNVLHFGVAAARQESGAPVGARYRTNYHLMDNRIDARPGECFSDIRDVNDACVAPVPGGEFDGPVQAGFEFAGAWGPVAVKSEYLAKRADGENGTEDYDIDGAYVNVQYTVGYNTAQAYSIKKGGTFGRVKGNNIWQFGARYDFIETEYGDDEVESDSLTLGSTYILNPYTRFKAEVVFAETELNDTDVQEDTVFQMRAQVDF